jgi:chromosome segregation protein
MHESGGAYDKGTQALLQADLEGVLDPLAALIQAPAQWEAAIEAALGNDLQAVLVRWALEQGAQLQKESWQVGRVTLLPLDDLRHRPPLPEGALSGASVVECDKSVRKVVDVVLGSIALCDDLSQAQALLPHMPPGSRCVTPEGIVLRADGALVVGQVGSSEVLADERARRELPKQLEGLRRRLQEMEENRQAVTQHIAALEERLREIDRQAAAKREKEARILQEKLGEARTGAAVIKETLRSQRADLRREREALEQLQAQRASLREQANRLASEHADALDRAQMLRDAVSQMEAQSEEEIQSTDKAPSGFRAKLAAAHQRCYEIEEQQRAASRRIASLEAELEQWTEQVTKARDKVARIERETLANARTAVAVVEESLRSQRAALKRELGLLEQLRSQVKARRQRAEDLKSERTALVTRVEELRQGVDHLRGALREIRQHIQPTEKTLDRLGEKRGDLEKRVQRARSRVRDAETHHGRAQMEVERAQDELRILAERIEEDFGLVELELAESVTAQTPLPMRPMVSELPVVEELPEGLEDEMAFLKKRLRQLGSINPNAPEELDEVQERHHFLTEQAEDLKAASTKLRQAVNDLDDLMEAAFQETFDAVAGRFSEMFTALFGGGTARLELIEPDDLLHTGIEIVARPPGKRAQRLALLSGGERALTAAALLFSLLHVSPTPFCVFDEVDAMLDEANVGRFRTQLERLAQQTQFIVITHNRNTVESADTVYGISMGSDAVSQVVSLKLEDIEEP